MAQVVTRTFIDDIDGSEAERTFAYTVDGIDYEIDLSAANIKEFNDAIAGFVESSRKAARRSATGSKQRAVKPGSNKEQNQAVREWARGQGLPVSERGRIAADVQAKFDAAHTGLPAAAERQMAWA